MTSRTKVLLWVIAGVVVLVAVISGQSSVAPQKTVVRNSVYGPETPRDRSQSVPAQPTKSKPAPLLTLTIDASEYERGYGGVDGHFRIVGTAENTGTAAAFSPTIKATITDSAGKTILAETSAWPAGQYLKHMAPGTKAAFQFSGVVPGSHEQVRWRVWVDGYDYQAKK